MQFIRYTILHVYSHMYFILFLDMNCARISMSNIVTLKSISLISISSSSESAPRTHAHLLHISHTSSIYKFCVFSLMSRLHFLLNTSWTWHQKWIKKKKNRAKLATAGRCLYAKKRNLICVFSYAAAAATRWREKEMIICYLSRK